MCEKWSKSDVEVPCRPDPVGADDLSAPDQGIVVQTGRRNAVRSYVERGIIS